MIHLERAGQGVRPWKHTLASRLASEAPGGALDDEQVGAAAPAEGERVAALQRENKALRRELEGLCQVSQAVAPILAELEAVEAQAAAAHEEGRLLAECLLQASEAQARAIVATAGREAQAVLERGRTESELARARASARAEEIRARAMASLRARLETLHERAHDSGGPDAPGQVAPVYEAAWPEQPEAHQGTVQEAPPAEQRAARSSADLQLSILPADGETLRYRLVGPLTLATMLALERTVARLPGVTGVSVDPTEPGVATLSLASADPERTLRDLQAMPEIAIQLEAE